MFNLEMYEDIFNDERLRDIPIAHISAVLSIIEDVVDKKFYSETDIEQVKEKLCRRN